MPKRVRTEQHEIPPLPATAMTSAPPLPATAMTSAPPLPATAMTSAPPLAATAMTSAPPLPSISQSHYWNFSGNSRGQHILLNEAIDGSRPEDKFHSTFKDACVGNDIELVRELLSKDDVKKKLVEDRKIIFMAAKYGPAQIVKLLLDAGANSKAIDSGQTLLHVAARYTQPQVVKVLLDAGADPSAINSDNHTPLDKAAIPGNTETVRFLLAAGADAFNLGRNGIQTLHNLVKNKDKDTELFKILLDAGANPNITDHWGSPIIHLAALYKLSDFVKHLLDAGADATKTNNDGETVFKIVEDRLTFLAHYSPLNQQTPEGEINDLHEILALLRPAYREQQIEAGAALTPDEEANPVLVFLHAVGTGNVTLCATVLKQPVLAHADDECIEPLSSEPNYLAKKAAQLLKSFTQHSVATKTLSDQKMIIEHMFTGARNALHVLASHKIPVAADATSHAVVFEEREIVTLLADNLGLDAKDGSGKTAFQKAVIAENVALLKPLVDLGANPNASFKYAGKVVTPLEYLMSTNQTKLFNTLVLILGEKGHLAEAVVKSGEEMIKFATENLLICVDTLKVAKAFIDNSKKSAEAAALDIHSDDASGLPEGAAANQAPVLAEEADEDDELPPLEHDDEPEASAPQVPVELAGQSKYYEEEVD